MGCQIKVGIQKFLLPLPILFPFNAKSFLGMLAMVLHEKIENKFTAPHDHHLNNCRNTVSAWAIT